MFNATPAPPARLLVTAATEFQGEKVFAQLVVDEQAWTYSPGARDEVKRQLRLKLAEEIMKRLDVTVTVAR